jgi:nucleotide-binding universal stress UspA family protein
VEQSRLEWLASDEDQARERAQEVGESVAERAPTDAEAVEVKPDPPSQVVLDAIAEHHPDRVLVVVRGGEDASWLELGEAERIPDEIQGVPVTLVQL